MHYTFHTLYISYIIGFITVLIIATLSLFLILFDLYVYLQHIVTTAY